MIPINNSDTAWLIVSDYNQDNDLPYVDLREDILNPEINDWNYHFTYNGVGSAGDGSSTGGEVASSSIREEINSIDIGDNYSYRDHVGDESVIGSLVGGSSLFL